MKGLALVCFHKTISVKLSVIGGSAVFSNPVLKVGKEQSTPLNFLPTVFRRLPTDRSLPRYLSINAWLDTKVMGGQKIRTSLQNNF